MRTIWRLNLESPEGLERIRRFNQPWLVENFYEQNDGDYPEEIRVAFRSRRSVSEIPNWERIQRFRQSIPYLYQQAQLAREKALSYRGFNVGVSLLAFKAGHDHAGSWRVFSGANTKHAPNMRPVCAEPIAINAALMENFSLIIGIVVVGLQREEDLGKILTLHPCHDCRWFMHGHPLVEQTTLVLTAKPGLTYFNYSSDRAEITSACSEPMHEIRTVGQLLRLHRKISGDDFT